VSRRPQLEPLEREAELALEIEIDCRIERDVVHRRLSERRAGDGSGEVEDVLERVARLEAAPDLRVAHMDADERVAGEALRGLLGHARERRRAALGHLRLVCALRHAQCLTARQTDRKEALSAGSERCKKRSRS